MLIIQIKNALELRLRGEAKRRGVNAADYAAGLLQQTAPPKAGGTNKNQTTLNLLDEWDAADKTSDPEEACRRSEDAEQFLQNLSRNRQQMEGPSARRLWH